jgi:hypothetical protein
MRRLFFAMLSVLVVAGLAGAVAFASSIHLKGGKNAKPTATDLGLVLNAVGDLSGLGNGDVLVTIVAKGNPTATCTNPGNGVHQPPGQNPAEVTLTGSQSIPASEIKNGNTPFDVTTEAPETPIPGAPGCPNTSWTEDITDVVFTSYIIIVVQGADSATFGPFVP